MIKQTDSSGSLALDTKGMDSLRQSAKTNSPDALKGVATQFEALFMNMVMKSMRDATPQDGMFDNQQSKMFTSMLDQQLTQSMAKRGLGLADVLVRQLSPSVGGAANGQPLTDSPGGADGLKLRASALLGALDKSANKEGFQAWQPGNLSGNLSEIPQNGSKLRTARVLGAGAIGDAYGASADKARANQPAHVRAFQDRLSAHAEEASRTTGIPAKFMLGQAALETGWGKREIHAKDGSASHNLFGIKAGPSWKGKVVTASTTEYVNGTPHTKLEKFRAYDSYADSFRDYAKLLTKNPRYENVIANAQDAAGFAQGLQRAGYATDPLYAAKLTRIINHSLAG